MCIAGVRTQRVSRLAPGTFLDVHIRCAPSHPTPTTCPTWHGVGLAHPDQLILITAASRCTSDVHPEQDTHGTADGRCACDEHCPRLLPVGAPTQACNIPGGVHPIFTSWHIARPTDGAQRTCTAYVRQVCARPTFVSAAIAYERGATPGARAMLFLVGRRADTTRGTTRDASALGEKWCSKRCGALRTGCRARWNVRIAVDRGLAPRPRRHRAEVSDRRRMRRRSDPRATNAAYNGVAFAQLLARVAAARDAYVCSRIGPLAAGDKRGAADDLYVQCVVAQ